MRTRLSIALVTLVESTFAPVTLVGCGLALITLAGCSRSDDKQTINTPDATVEVDGSSVKIETRDGKTTINQDGDGMRVDTDEGSMVMGAGDLPAGFPIPVLPGAKVESHAHMTPVTGSEVFQLSLTSPASVPDVAAFYEKFFKDKNVSVTRNEQTSSEGKMIMLFGASEEADATAMVVSEGASGPTTATVSWSKKK